MSARSLRALFLAALLAAACAGLPADRRTEAMLERSGLLTSVYAVRAQMQGALTDERMHAAIDAAFARERLRPALVRETAGELSPEDEEAVLRWHSAGVGRRIGTLDPDNDEYRAATSMMGGRHAWQAEVTAARGRRIRDLVARTRAGEASADLAHKMHVALTRGQAYRDPEAARAKVDILERFYRDNRESVAQVATAAAILEYAYMCRGFSDAEFDAALAFWDSPLGQRFSTASHKAMEAVLVEASYAAGKAYADSLLQHRLDPAK